MIGIALTEKLADTTESASETASEIVQDAEQKAGLLRQYMTDLLDWCMSKVGSLVVAVIFMVIGFRVVKWIIKLIKRTFYNIDNSGIHCRFSGYFICYIAWNGGCDDRSCVAGQPVQSCRWCADPDIETISCR